MSNSPNKKRVKTKGRSPVETLVVCFEVNTSEKPLLHISIVESNLPHNMMPIGQSQTSAVFSLLLVYDTLVPKQKWRAKAISIWKEPDEV
jgi:hypothetical protein